MVFKTYYKGLVTYSASILKSTEEAEDLVQQLFFNLWAKKEELGVHSSLKAYLYRAVYNTSLNRIKQQNTRSLYVKESLATASVAETSVPLQQKELQQQIDRALGSLPEQCGVIFKMSRFEQLKYQEIADKLGLSVKTVENQMGKALKLMREQLKDHLPALAILLILNSLSLG